MQNLHSIKVASSIPWPPWLMWRDLHTPIFHCMTFLTVLVALTVIFVGMMASNGRANVPSSSPGSISDSGRRYLDDLSRRANEMEQHNRFLRDSVLLLSRFGGHCNSCTFLLGGNCCCNHGAYTFADYEDFEAQLLKPGNINGVKNITQLKPETACGLQNTNHVFNGTTNATDALDAAVSICTVASGQSQGQTMCFSEREASLLRPLRTYCTFCPPLMISSRS